MTIEYLGTDKAIAPVTVDLTANSINFPVKAADPAKIESYQGTIEGKYIYVDPAELPVANAITVDKNKNTHNGQLYFDANDSNVTSKGFSNLLLVQLQDAYKNPIKDGTVALSKILEDAKFVSDDNSLNLDGSNIVDINYSGVDVPAEDTVTITAALVEAKNIEVSVVDTTPIISTIETSFVSNAVLKGGYVPFRVTAKNQFGKEMDDQTVQIVISDSTKVEIKEIDATGSLGDSVTTGSEVNTSKTYVVRGVNVGTTDLTFRNVAGTVSATQTIEVVSNLEALASAEEDTTPTTDPIAAVEDAIVAAGTVNIDGYFKKYDFNQNNAYDPNDWAYKVVSNGNTYQLLGTTPTDTNPFGWKAVDVSVDEPYDYYFVHYGSGAFDWAVVKPDCSAVYKLAGAKADNTFSYDVDGDGVNDQLNLTCTISGTQITFSKK
jgi:hypothetical protein